MSAILFSIKPQYVEAIRRGWKCYEYRKHPAKRQVKKMYIYETAPKKKVVAFAHIAAVITKPKEYIWAATSCLGGISKKDFDEYFQGQEMATAYIFYKVKFFDKPLELAQIGVKKAPQSYCYVDR